MNKEIENTIDTLEYKYDINLNINTMSVIRDKYSLQLQESISLSMQEKMKIFHIISLTYYRETKYTECIYFAEKVSRLATEINNEYYLAKSYGWIALNNLILKNNRECEKYYNMAENIFNKLEKYEDIAILLSRVAVVLFRNGYTRTRLKEVVDINLTYMDKFESPLSAQIYMSIASSYSIGLNNFHTAIDIYSKALDLARKYNLLDIEALTLYYIGVGYFELNMNQKAIDTFNNILSDTRFKDNFTIKAIVSLDLISVHIDNKIDIEKVRKIIDTCEVTITKLDELKKEQFTVQLDLFKIKYSISKNKSSSSQTISLLENVKAIYDKYGESFIFSHVDFWIQQLFGIIYLELEDYDNAIAHQKKALELSHKYETRYTIESYEHLSNIYEHIGDFKNAFIFMKKANNEYKEVDNTEILRKYVVTQDNYEKLISQERERSQFLATLSHELKTPINIIYSSLQLLSLFKDKNDKAFKEYYLKHEDSVKLNCLRMLKLIGNIIDMIKLDTGIFKPNFINYNIVELVEDITMSVLSSVELKGIEIIFDTEVEESIIQCDPNMIERILLNLLSNAIKFSPVNGKINVNITKQNSYIVISVSDNGLGIPFEMKKKIFNKFEQIDKTLNRKSEGSGIGLSIVKSLVDLHSGYIEVFSEESVGSDFRIYIPNFVTHDTSEDVSFDKYDILKERVYTEFSDIYTLYN